MKDVCKTHDQHKYLFYVMEIQVVDVSCWVIGLWVYIKNDTWNYHWNMKLSYEIFKCVEYLGRCLYTATVRNAALSIYFRKLKFGDNTSNLWSNILNMAKQFF